MLFRIFRFLIYVYFNEAYEKTFFFLIQTSKIHFKMYYITEYQDVESCDTKMAVRNNDNNKTETKQHIRRPVI